MFAKRSSSPADKSAVSEIGIDLHPMIRINKNGRTEGVMRSPFVAASEDPGITGVATRDVVVDRETTGVAARLFLPIGAVATGRKLPLVLFFHGGSSFLAAESAFCRTYHTYATSLAARARALVVSVEYRLAPEHPITAAYDDAWTALRWAASSFADPWLLYHADPRITFLAGDGAGGNIAYHTAVRASRAGKDIDIEGLLLIHPYFWGSELQWSFTTAGRAGINYDPRINPPDEIAPLPCRRALVAVDEKGAVRERGRRLAARMRSWWWGGEVTIVELQGEDNSFFHLYGPARSSSEKLMESVVEFVNKKPTVTPMERDGSRLNDKKEATSGLMYCAELAPSMSAEVPRRTVTKSCL
ncbi:putative carboxylesterase 2 [Dichanthelium oligosanthes]|uniref:Putative carboxylesterase 2 n=1 Tax=Dichanthelium oligosanthes TaxID=888268 RepID=A0A1E5VVI2_9POAL|nr:putative carboxylesterase 2 [Dichanthelium oligosanthes]